MVAPVATMPGLTEGLHNWEKKALLSLSDTASKAGNAQMDGALSQLQALLANNPNYTQLSGNAVSQGMAPVTAGEVTSLQNPMVQGLKDNLSQSAERIRAQIVGKQGLRGGRSFGDTSTGTQLAGLNDSVLSGMNQLDYQSWQDALDQVNQNRNFAFAGANQYGSLGANQINAVNGLFDMASALKQSRISDMNNKLNAGQYVRQFNQGINDKLTGNIIAEQNAPYEMAMKMLELSKGFQSNNTSGAGVSNLERYGGLAQALSGLFKDENKDEVSV